MLQKNFKSDEAVLLELKSYLRGYDYSIVCEEENYFLKLKKRPFYPWTAPGKKRWFLGHPPSSVHYEPVVTAALDYFIDHSPIETFYDIGAESGYFSWLGASRHDRSISSFAFEMRPDSSARIGQMARRFPNVDIRNFNAGMSDEYDGIQTVWFSRMKLFEHKPNVEEYQDGFFTRLKFQLRGSLKSRMKLTRADITIESIDHFSETQQIVPDIIKIDVEGYEGKVILGGLNTFRQHKPVTLLELHKSKHLKRTGMSRLDAVTPLFEADYSCILLENHHDLTKAAPRLVDIEDRVWKREKTDFFIFF